MDIKELRDDFLMEIGCSIKKTYQYMPKNNFDYYEDSETKRYTFSRMTVLASPKIKNSQRIHTHMNKGIEAFKAEPITSVENAAFELPVALAGFFGDFLKYSVDNFKVDERLFNYICVTIVNNINYSKGLIKAVLEKYNIELNDAAQTALSKLEADNLSVMKEVSRNIAAGTRMYDDHIFGGTRVVSGASVANNGLSLEANLSMNIDSAESTKELYSKIAKMTAEGALKEVRSKAVSQFVDKIYELFSVKLDDIFDEYTLLYEGKSMEENPLLKKNIDAAVVNLAEEEVEDFKALLSYYNLSAKGNIAEVASANIATDYSHNHAPGYEDRFCRLYKLYTGEDVATHPLVRRKVYDVVSAEVEAKCIEDISKNELKTWFDTEKERIQACPYIPIEDKDILMARCAQWENYIKNFVLPEKKLEAAGKVGNALFGGSIVGRMFKK